MQNNKGLTLFKYGKIKIGNNVFIGCNSTILPNVKIGNNCIIGTGSIVTKDIPDGEVWAGNPARFITTIDEYTKKSIDLYNTDEQTLLRKYVVEKRSIPT